MPTEPLAGPAKTTPIMAVLVQGDGEYVLDYELKLGGIYPVPCRRQRQRVYGAHRPAPDSEMFMDAEAATSSRSP